MKRKIIALVAALAVGSSVSAYAATCNLTPSASSAPAKAVTTTVAAARTPSADSAVQAVLSKAPAAVKGAAAASSAKAGQTCSGGSCASNAACKANSCTNGSACTNGNCTASNACGTVKSAASASSAASGAAAAKQTCSAGSCTSNAACKASSCTTGTTCPSGNCTASNACGTVIVYGNCQNGNYSQLINGILNGKTGTTCSGGTCPSSKTASSGSTSSKTVSSTPASSSSYSSFQNEVVRLVNVERAKNGLAALSSDSLLMKTATVKSQDMAKNNYFSHTSPTYGSPFDLMKQYGVSYRAAGENIAMGQTSPAQVMNGWMNSAGHRANILNSSFTKIGVGVAQNSAGQYYWTQHFIG